MRQFPLNLPYLGMETTATLAIRRIMCRLNLPYLGMETSNHRHDWRRTGAQSSLFRNGNLMMSPSSIAIRLTQSSLFRNGNGWLRHPT